MKKLLAWLKESAQGRDNKASSRSIVNYWIVVLVTALVVNHIVLTNYVVRKDLPNPRVIDILDVNNYLIIVLCAFIGMLFGIIAFQSITEFIRTVKGGSVPPTPIEIQSHTQTTTTVVPKENGTTAVEEVKE